MRLLLCSAIAALALATAPEPARAHHRDDVYHVHSSFVGFLDYRRSLDDDGDCSDRLDRRREYVFHCMSGREAYEVWHGGGHDGGYQHRHDHGCGSHAVAITRRTWHGGGTHQHAWGVHASDNCENH